MKIININTENQKNIELTLELANLLKNFNYDIKLLPKNMLYLSTKINFLIRNFNSLKFRLKTIKYDELIYKLIYLREKAYKQKD